MRRKIRQLAVAGLVCGALCAAGCGKREDARVPAAREDITTQRMETTKPAAGAAHVTDEKAGIGAELARLDTAMHAGEILMGLISREDTNGLDLASVSNAVAGIDSETIIRFCEENLESGMYDNPRTIAIAQMFEVVAARAEPVSSRMYALLRLYQLYNEFNAARGYVPEEWVKEKKDALKRLELSAHPTEAERSTYSTIQGILVMGEHDPEREVAAIRRLREMQAQGIISLPKQWMDMNERNEVTALLESRQGKEAYEKMKASFEKHQRGELDPSVWCEKSFTNFEAAFDYMSNLYYGAPLRLPMRVWKQEWR